MILTQIAVTTLGSGLLFLGVREAVAPRAGAPGYGVPVAADAPPPPNLEVKANGDIALGGLLIGIATLFVHVATAAYSLLVALLAIGGR